MFCLDWDTTAAFWLSIVVVWDMSCYWHCFTFLCFSLSRTTWRPTPCSRRTVSVRSSSWRLSSTTCCRRGACLYRVPGPNPGSPPWVCCTQWAAWTVPKVRLTRRIQPMLVYCWATVEDGGPTLSRHWDGLMSWTTWTVLKVKLTVECSANQII